MISKFLLIIVIAKLLPLSELGIYGLLVAGISFAVLFVGFDYYIFSNRELLSVRKNKWSNIIVNQVYAYIPLYLLFFPLSIIVYYSKLIPEGYFVWFLVLVVIEHVSLELNRLLNTMQKQLFASIVLFLRSGVWVWLIIPVMLYLKDYRTLDTVLFAWLLGGLLSIIFGTTVISKSIKEWKFNKPQYKWIFNGYKAGLMFIFGTLAFTAISTGDRFFLEKLMSKDIVGIYTFFTTLTIGATAFIHAGVIVFISPKIISAYRKRKFYKYQQLMRLFLKELLISVFIMVCILLFLMPFVIEWLDKDYYFEYYNVFYIILATSVLVVLRSYLDTYLYAAKKDKFTILSNISAFVVFILLLILFYYYNDNLAVYKVSQAVLITFSWLLLVKLMGFMYYNKFESTIK